MCIRAIMFVLKRCVCFQVLRLFKYVLLRDICFSADIEVNVPFMMQLDKLVQLIESPIFIRMYAYLKRKLCEN